MAEDDKTLFRSDWFKAGYGHVGGAIGKHEVFYSQTFQNVLLHRQTYQVVTWGQ